MRAVFEQTPDLVDVDASVVEAAPRQLLAVDRRGDDSVSLLGGVITLPAADAPQGTLTGVLRPEDILVHPDFGSFPSGHAASAGLLLVIAVPLLIIPVFYSGRKSVTIVVAVFSSCRPCA